MPVFLLRSGLALAALMAVPASSSGVQDQSDADATRRANSAPQQLLSPSYSAAPAAATSNPALASAIAQWRAVQLTDALPFDTYAGFLLAHPGWPGEAAVRRAAEKQAGNAAPYNIVAFFNRFSPQSAAAGVRYALALVANGQVSAANEAARTAWRRGALSPTDEAAVLSTFGSALGPDDHDARMDALLWQGQTAAAQRQLALVSPTRASVFATRLALRSNAPDASSRATVDQARLAGDPGYVADYANWLRSNGAEPSARTWLARSRTLLTPPGNATAWLQLLLAEARGAAADQQWQVAYDIGRQVDDAFPAGTDIAARSYAERDAYTDLVWLAAQAALNKLGRPADAMPLFERYSRGSRSPSIQSKGLYWAGRAAEAARLSTDSQSYLTRAAGYRDQYYGQLAAERLGRPLTPPPPMVPRAVDPAVRTAFFARETVRAAQLLGTIGDWQDQTAFVRQIALDAHSDADHVLADELSRTLDRPDLGVMVGRSALQNGLSDYSLAGFPTVAVPDAYADQWTMIHAIARQESQFDRAALSRTGARGLMQLMPGTARDTARKVGLPYDAGRLSTDTGYNVQLGSSFFAQIFARYGSYPLAIAAYNAGPGNVNKWLAANGDPRTPGVDPVVWVEQIPFSETRNYVQRVLENAVVYDLISPQHARSRGPANLSWYLGKGRPG